MPIQSSLPIFRRNPIQSITQILPNILVPILIHTQRTARMLHKQIEQPDLVGRDLGQGRDYFRGDEVGTPGAGGEGEGFLEPGRRHFLSGDAVGRRARWGGWGGWGFRVRESEGVEG